MKLLPPALEPLSAYPQFLNYKLVNRMNGKVDKLPLNPATGEVCDAHATANHVGVDIAISTGLPIAYVFAGSDPFFFLDIDDCMLPSGQWDDNAKNLCAMFAGCAIEVSQSGRGLHIFGIAPTATTHTTVSRELGSQFYTSGRFVALTGTGAVGDAGFTPNADVYDKFITDYFPPPALGATDSDDPDWTDTPDPEWSGPEDDTELIRRMLLAKSARGILGATATVRQLWEADGDALSKVFEDSGGQGREFDWSLADAALCAHLAFWTGKNCDRMDRLFRQSGLIRDKWDRDYYRERTILRAVGGCSKVYRQRGAGPVATAPGGAVDGSTGLAFYTLQDQIPLFAGCCYVQDVHKIFVPDIGALLKPEQFKATYGGRVFALDALGTKSTRNAWEVFTESQAFRFPWAHSACFRPELGSCEIIEVEGSKLVNTYVPVPTNRKAGDPGPFFDVLKKMLPVAHDREILLSYMAACVQYVGHKFQWAPLLQGVQGNGKTFIGTCLMASIGERHTHMLDPKDISNVFNKWLQGKLLVMIEEVNTRAKVDTIEALKWMVTNHRVPSQGKGSDQGSGDNRANFFMCANHKDAIRKTKRDRRFCVFYTAQQSYDDMRACGMIGDYFPKLYKWARGGGYAIVNNYLREYKIKSELNPATLCHRAPETSSTQAVIEGSRSVIEQDLIEAVESGKTGFNGGWISSMKFDELLKDLHVKIPHNRRKEILEDLGYLAHPALYRGRVNNVIALEHGKPRLYIKKGHPSANIIGAAAVTKAYEIAQGYVVYAEPREVVTSPSL